MGKISFSDGKPWENDPGFETRLQFTMRRMGAIFRNFTVSAVCAVILGTLSGMAYLILTSIAPNGDKSPFYLAIVAILGSALIGFVGLIVTLYYNLDSIYGRKWSSVFDKYYQVQNVKDDIDREFGYCNICEDIINLGLWGDNAFEDLMFEHIAACIRGVEIKSQVAEQIRRFTAKEMKTYEAKKYLDTYAKELLAGRITLAKGA